MKTKNTKPTNEEVPQLPVGAGNVTLEQLLKKQQRKEVLK
jgi:hypothetical protein